MNDDADADRNDDGAAEIADQVKDRRRFAEPMGGKRPERDDCQRDPQETVAESLESAGYITFASA